MSPRRRSARKEDGAFRGSVDEAQGALSRAIKLCRGDVSKYGRASTQGRVALRRVRKISMAISLLDEVKGQRLLQGDPDLVSDEEAAQRTRDRLEERDRKAQEARVRNSLIINEV